MNLAYLSGTAIPSDQASTIHVVKMAQALAQVPSNRSVRLYGYSGSETSLAAHYGVEPAFDPILWPQPTIPVGWGFHFAWSVRQHQRWLAPAQRADAFYGRHVHGLVAAARLGLPVGYEAHALPSGRLKRTLERHLFMQRTFRALVCITEALAEDYRQWLADDLPITVLPDAADAVNPAAPLRPLSDWPGRADTLQVGFVGHLYPGKGMELIVQLAPRLPHVDFHIVGGRSQDVDRWRAQSTAPNLYFHGYVPHADLPAYYARLDVGLLPLQSAVHTADGRREIGRWTSPLKAFEYMAHGLVILASDLPVLREVFSDQQNALLLPADEPQRWADTLSRISTAPQGRSDLGRRARSDFLARYTWSARAERVSALMA
ncbi:MAG: glycosyltransferase family 4 protein [Pseudomonadota bacterium]